MTLFSFWGSTFCLLLALVSLQREATLFKQVVFPSDISPTSLVTWMDAHHFLVGTLWTDKTSLNPVICIAKSKVSGGGVSQRIYLKIAQGTMTDIDIVPSPRGDKILLYHPHSGSTEVFSASGKQIHHDQQRYGGARRIQWFPDSIHWLEDTIFTPRWGETHLAALGNVLSKKVTYLVDAQTHKSILTQHTFTLTGNGDSLWLLDIPFGKVSLESVLEGLSTNSVTIRQMRILPHTTHKSIGGVLNGTKVTVQEVQLIHTKTLILPQPLCIQDAVFSPNGQRILWLCYPVPPKGQKNQKPDGLQLYVSTKNQQGLHHVADLEPISSLLDVGKIGWCNSNSDAWLRKDAKAYTLHLNFLDTMLSDTPH